MYKKFKEILKRATSGDMHNAAAIITEEFENWKNYSSRQDQVDDICIMGVKN